MYSKTSTKFLWMCLYSADICPFILVCCFSVLQPMSGYRNGNVNCHVTMSMERSSNDERTICLKLVKVSWDNNMWAHHVTWNVTPQCCWIKSNAALTCNITILLFKSGLYKASSIYCHLSVSRSVKKSPIMIFRNISLSILCVLVTLIGRGKSSNEFRADGQSKHTNRVNDSMHKF